MTAEIAFESPDGPTTVEVETFQFLDHGTLRFERPSEDEGAAHIIQIPLSKVYHVSQRAMEPVDVAHPW